MKWFNSNPGRSLPLPALQGKIIEVAERNFKVEEHLGDGGFAVIYRVKDLSTGESFALKHVIMNSEEAKNALRDEAKIMKKVQGHRNVLSLHSVAFGLEKDGQQDAYMLMDLCKESLFNYLQKFSFKLEDGEVLTIFLSVCQAVQHLHSQKHPVLHRDIKVENVLRRPDGTWVLCDYGSAKSKSRSSSKNKNLQEDQQEINRMTTPAYRAPEMWDLMMGQKVDEKADIWALGCMLYLMCFGSLPFTGESQLEVMAGKQNLPKTRNTLFSKAISEMLQVEPTKRPSIDSVIQLLENLNSPKQEMVEKHTSVELTPESTEHRPSTMTTPGTAPPPASASANVNQAHSGKSREVSAGGSLRTERLVSNAHKQRLRNTESPVPLPKVAPPKATVLTQRTFPDANTFSKPSQDEKKETTDQAEKDSLGSQSTNHQLLDEMKALRMAISHLTENNKQLWSKILSLEKVVKSQEQAILELQNNQQESHSVGISNPVQETSANSNYTLTQDPSRVMSPTPTFPVSPNPIRTVSSETRINKSVDKSVEDTASTESKDVKRQVEAVPFSNVVDTKPATLVPQKPKESPGVQAKSKSNPTKTPSGRFGGTFWKTRVQNPTSKVEDESLNSEDKDETTVSSRHKRVVSDPPPLDSWHPSLGR